MAKTTTRIVRRRPSTLHSLSLLVILAALSPTPIDAFYLPGLAPVNFCEESKASETCKSEVKMFVNRLDSEESVIPYEYSHFDFCQASEEESPVENLGQVVFGERIRPSPYNISFLKSEECKALCAKEYDLRNSDSVEKINFLMKGMLKNYQQHFIVDNVPVSLPNVQNVSLRLLMPCFYSFSLSHTAR